MAVQSGLCGPGRKPRRPVFSQRGSFCLSESQVEFWLLGHYLCLNEKLGVFTGEISTSIEENKAEQIYDDKYLELLYRTAESFKSLHLSKEEVAILRVITLTFTGISYFV